MSYNKTIWENGATALSAENMNKIENELVALDTDKVDKVTGKGLSTNDFTDTLKTKLDGVSSGAEVNQNAFSNIAVGGTTIAAEQKTDTLTLVAGSNVQLTPDATNDKVTISATDTKYNAATTSAAGLMSAADKSKLDSLSGVVFGTSYYDNYQPAPTDTIVFYNPALIGKTYIICSTQDAGNPVLRASLESATGKVTLKLSGEVTLQRTNYIAW